MCSVSFLAMDVMDTPKVRSDLKLLDTQVGILERTSGNDQASRGVRQLASHIRRLIAIVEDLVRELETESLA